jgi:molybdate transport system substrate-binding protein
MAKGNTVTTRRGFLGATATLPLLAAPLAAEANTTDLVLTCDTTLGPAMRQAARRFRAGGGVLVRVFPTGPGLIVPQLERQIQNDLLMTQSALMDQAEREALVAPGASRGAWRNPLVIAARAGGPASGSRLAVSDPLPGSDMDGPVIARALGRAAPDIIGVHDTDAVIFLLLRGDAAQGLLHMTDVRAHPELTVIAPVPELVAPPLLYTAAVTKLAWRPNPEAFLNFLVSDQARALLAEQGLEVVS